MSRSDVPLVTEAAWAGVWVRHRTHPTPKSWSGRVTVEPWHRIAEAPLDPHERIATVCRRIRYGLMWPGGLGALEIARPNVDYPELPATLPGAVCRRCAAYRVPDEDEIEVPIADIDTLADRVASRLIARAEERRDPTEVQS